MRFLLFSLLALFMLLIGVSMLARAQTTDNQADAYENLVRDKASTFHMNFNSGDFETNGLLVTEDIDINSNNVKLSGRADFVKRIERYSVPFPGLQLKDRILVVDGNVAAVNYVSQGEQKGPFGTIAATGRKVQAMGAELMVFNNDGLMKKLLTVTESDRLLAEIKGTITIDSFENVPRRQNASKDESYRGRIRIAAGDFDRNFNDGKIDADRTMVEPGVRVNADNTLSTGPEALLAPLLVLKTAFPDMTISDEYVLVDGDRAAVEYIMDGTPTASLKLSDGSTVPPSCQRIHARGFKFMQFDNAGLLSDLIIVHNSDDLNPPPAFVPRQN